MVTGQQSVGPRHRSAAAIVCAVQHGGIPVWRLRVWGLYDQVGNKRARPCMAERRAGV